MTNKNAASIHLTDRVNAIAEWGKLIQRSVQNHQFEKAFRQAELKNPWFTQDNLLMSVNSICRQYLSKTALTEWIQPYSEALQTSGGKRIGLIMAGNIPLAGFHDLLTTIISGHIALVKMSSKDNHLLSILVEELFQIEPAFRNRIEFVDKLSNFDAVIATGSNNSSRYFEYYFSNYPHIIRKNRNSAAILTGDENSDERIALARDVFSYFGLGCRNVSKLYIPRNYNLTELFESFREYEHVFNHNKYRNNYDYNKSILLVNKQKHLDTGFLLLENKPDALASPIATLYYSYYDNIPELAEQLQFIKDQIQCVVTNLVLENLPVTSPGHTQEPALQDYADQVDTMNFLTRDI